MVAMLITLNSNLLPRLAFLLSALIYMYGFCGFSIFISVWNLHAIGIFVKGLFVNKNVLQLKFCSDKKIYITNEKIGFLFYRQIYYAPTSFIKFNFDLDKSVTFFNTNLQILIKTCNLHVKYDLRSYFSHARVTSRVLIKLDVNPGGLIYISVHVLVFPLRLH